jgi:hypothetical protein
VGMIARRRSPILPRLADQMTRFSGARVQTFDCLVACWVKAGSTRIDYSSIGEVDLVRLFAALQAAGFINGVPDMSGIPADLPEPAALKDLPEAMDRLALPVAAF